MHNVGEKKWCRGEELSSLGGPLKRRDKCASRYGWGRVEWGVRRCGCIGGDEWWVWGRGRDDFIESEERRREE